MDALIRWGRHRLLSLMTFFAHTDRKSERSAFGLGQFVLLLTLAPFIFNLSLYSFRETQEVASHYEYQADRFETSLLFQSFQDQSLPYKPRPPQKKLTKSEHKRLNYCDNHRKTIIRWVSKKKCRVLNEKRLAYKHANDEYEKDLERYYKKIELLNKKKDLYNTFEPKLSSKPQPLPDIEVKQTSSRSFSTLLSSSLALNAWQKITDPIWFIGLLLIFPTVWLCIKRRYWGLLAFGLSIPAINYLSFIVCTIFSVDSLSTWQINSTLAPKVAFAWLVIRGRVFSKSLGVFILFMSLCAILPSLLGEQGYQIFKAQLPIVIFIAAYLVLRLFVKGVQENAYLFRKLGWLTSLRSLIHSLVLWLPMALLALPYFYITEVAIPIHSVGKLHEANVLQFNHEHDMLDNALQSTAVKADDAMYAWHLTVESIRRDIIQQGKKLGNINLEKMVEEKYEAIMPNSLEFEDYDSDAFLVGHAVELSVDVAQSSTNHAYKQLRLAIKKNLGDIAGEQDTQFKEAVKGVEEDALKFADQLYIKGRDAILEANRRVQATIWWTFNYAQATHQLTILAFIFICLKSLAYVFARVSFNRDTTMFITLGESEGRSQQKQIAYIKRTGLQYLISGDSEATYFISRRFQCRGKAPKFSMPQPFSAPIARLFNGAYSMNKVVMTKGDDTVSCSAAQGIEFFEWDLRDGESVVFDFHNFVGMSDTVNISTLISTRISSLLIGGMIYSQATGPGKLILMAKGRAEITDSVSNSGSLPPERLVAMQTNTRLQVDSELDIVNIYLSTAYIRPAGGGHVIVDVDSQRGTKTGLISFLKRFILPI